jgi:hypothetical protein
MFYDEETIRLAVDIAVGDDGFKGRKVLDILRSLAGEDHSNEAEVVQ